MVGAKLRLVRRNSVALYGTVPGSWNAAPPITGSFGEDIRITGCRGVV